MDHRERSLWLYRYLEDLFMSDATEGLQPFDENGKFLPDYIAIDDATGAVIMQLLDDDGEYYELRVTPL